MKSLAEHFALLAADARPTDDSQLLTRTTGFKVEDGDVLVGVDSLGQRHLLAPVGAHPIDEDRVSRGVVLVERELEVGQDLRRFADLVCVAPRLTGPFEQLASDVVSRLQVAGARPPVTMSQALDDWRALLRGGLAGLSREVVLGLIGELEVLARAAEIDPVAAVEGWGGPSGATHDFQWGVTVLEVKTTTAVLPASVHVSSPDQLDPALVDDLYLAVVHMVESSAAPDLEERISALVESGVPRDPLEAGLRELKYVRGMDVGMATRYGVRDLRMWQLGSESPVLRLSDIEPAALASIKHIQYDLVLGGLGEPMGSSRVAEFFRSTLG